jgi:hypothetical protein
LFNSLGQKCNSSLVTKVICASKVSLAEFYS